MTAFPQSPAATNLELEHTDPTHLPELAWWQSEPGSAGRSFGNETVSHYVEPISEHGAVAHVREPLRLENGRVGTVAARRANETLCDEFLSGRK